MRKQRTIIGLSLAAAATYVCSLLALKPVFSNWGATSKEIDGPLPGDHLATGFTSTHAITIKAPVEKVWPWLVQMGQDRAGFYSYTWLENAALADMHNSDRIRLEWQDLDEGSSMRLASKKVYGDLSLLRVVEFVENDHFVPEGWGAFIVRPIDDETTRLIVRTHGHKPVMGGAASSFLFWEPAHFIMERGMLRGIKRRAEDSVRTNRV